MVPQTAGWCVFGSNQMESGTVKGFFRGLLDLDADCAVLMGDVVPDVARGRQLRNSHCSRCEEPIWTLRNGHRATGTPHARVQSISSGRTRSIWLTSSARANS